MDTFFGAVASGMALIGLYGVVGALVRDDDEEWSAALVFLGGAAILGSLYSFGAGPAVVGYAFALVVASLYLATWLRTGERAARTAAAVAALLATVLVFALPYPILVATGVHAALGVASAVLIAGLHLVGVRHRRREAERLAARRRMIEEARRIEREVRAQESRRLVEELRRERDTGIPRAEAERRLARATAVADRIAAEREVERRRERTQQILHSELTSAVQEVVDAIASLRDDLTDEQRAEVDADVLELVHAEDPPSRRGAAAQLAGALTLVGGAAEPALDLVRKVMDLAY